MIGIIGAMEIEVEGLKSMMRDSFTNSISGINYTVGLIQGKECVVAMSGVGKVSAAVCTQTMVLKYKPELIINVGIAGGIADGMKIGDIALASSVVQHDMDTSAVGDKKGLISGINVINIECATHINKALMSIKDRFKETSFYNGVIATGDQFINSREKLLNIKEEFDAIACEMEGGSIGQVCYINKVDFAVIRAISDSADDDSHIDYPKFAKSAAEISNKIILEILKL